MQADRAAAACIPIGTAAALNTIRNNMTGDYCLTANINAATLGNFAPIGVGGPPADPAMRFFKGTLDGKGFAISNLKIDDTASDITGFFRVIDGGTVKNIRFLNANVKSSTRNVGVIVGIMTGTTAAILNSSATGKVEGTSGDVGGLAGSCSNNAKISDSFFDGTVTGIDSDAGGLVSIALSGCTLLRTYAAGSVSTTGHGTFTNAGGLVAYNTSGIVTKSFARNSVTATGANSIAIVRTGGLVGDNLLGTVSESFATGPVTISSGSSSSSAGGLIGWNSNTINLSFSTGPVTVVLKGYGGGFAGFSYSKAITDSYSTSPVSGNTNAADGGYTGGFVGGLSTNGSISRSFSAGKVVGAVGKTGGLVALIFNPGLVTQSHWDRNTSGQSTSAVGTSKTTVLLRAALQSGFAAPNWGITRQVSYPFLSRPGMTFWSTLATTVKTNRIFTFLPIQQLDTREYGSPAPNRSKASEAAVYTMIARAIGITKNIAGLKAIKINAYWNDAAQTTSFTGAITAHATRSGLVTLPAAATINAGNILGPIKSNKVVLITGPGAGGSKHYMLATSYLVNSANQPTVLIANDPLTGRQVRINVTTRKVVAPAGFPLANFKVNAFRVITIN